MIPALALLIIGYDIAYYAANVLVWAHLRATDKDPVPLRYCIGIPFGDGAGGGGKFMPPFKLATDLPQLEAVTARQLMGGEPWATLLASAYDTGAGTIPNALLPGDGAAQQDPDQTGVIPRLPGENATGGGIIASPAPGTILGAPGLRGDL